MDVRPPSNAEPISPDQRQALQDALDQECAFMPPIGISTTSACVTTTQPVPY